MLLAAIAAGCSSATTPADAGGVDMSEGCGWTCLWDLAGSEDDLGGGGNECGDFDPSCTDVGFGPGSGVPFPLPSDKPADPNVGSEGVGRDKNGYLGLDSSHASFDYLWLANWIEMQRGTITKLDSKAMREVARYFSVTCNSLKTGSAQACDGQNGCCAQDSHPQFSNRRNNMPQGPYQQVLLRDNYPSRTAVDFNGDMWVANRAFGGQSSVTKIANDPSDCIDRNKDGRINTSRDVDGNGVIETDCNGDGAPDDLATVKAKPCSNGLDPEFLGLDDECVLLTTNTNVSNAWGRPLALGPGAQDFGPSDPWAGSYNDGYFYRIDGTTGITKEEAVLPQGCKPYGVAIDSAGIAWAGPLMTEGPLCYFNTKKVQEVGTARQPQGSRLSGYGISMDRDQNVWLGGFGADTASRYTPDRTKGFQGLGQGTWTVVSSPGRNNGAGTNTWGIAADSRTANQYWVWVYADTHVVRIPGSDLPLPKNGQDVQVDGSAYPAMLVAGGPEGRGVGLDRDQNVWAASKAGSVATRIKVDAMGTMTPPDLNSPPMGNNKCPAGDRCPYGASPYTYSDFTGFGLRNFTRSKGYYRYVQKGCSFPNETRWVAVKWDTDVPLNTVITMRARAGNTPVPDQTWGPWTFDFAVSPADLVNGMPLAPNQKDSGYIQVEFDFSTQDRNASPKLKSFDLLYECIGDIG